MPYWGYPALLAVLLGSVFNTACEPVEPPPASQSSRSAASQTHWQLKMTTSGGFAGISESISLDDQGQATFTNRKTSTKINQILPTAALIEFEFLVKNLPDTLPSYPRNPGCRDCFDQVLEIQRNGQAQRLVIGSPPAPESALARLLARLAELSLNMKKQATTKP